MRYVYDYQNCRAIVKKAEDGEILCDTCVRSFDQQTMHITMDAQGLKTYTNAVYVLILGPDFVFEHKGRILRLRETGQVQVALYHGKQKPGRTAKRYQINAPATVRYLEGTQAAALHPQPIPVTIVDISVSGVLIKAGSNELDIGDAFCITINIEGQVLVNSTVVRVQEADAENLLYGCAFASVQK